MTSRLKVVSKCRQ